jgi:hypothetical protein
VYGGPIILQMLFGKTDETELMLIDSFERLPQN